MPRPHVAGPPRRGDRRTAGATVEFLESLDQLLLLASLLGDGVPGLRVAGAPQALLQRPTDARDGQALRDGLAGSFQGQRTLGHLRPDEGDEQGHRQALRDLGAEPALALADPG